MNVWLGKIWLSIALLDICETLEYVQIESISSSKYLQNIVCLQKCHSYFHHTILMPAFLSIPAFAKLSFINILLAILLTSSVSRGGKELLGHQGFVTEQKYKEVDLKQQ